MTGGTMGDALLVLVPILLPFVAAMLCLLYGGRSRLAHRLTTSIVLAATLVVAAVLVGRVADGSFLIARPGAWPAPFGIVLVADRLAALMLLLTDVVAVGALGYALAGGSDAAGRHFHAFFLLQLAGLHGAFLTGDLFNLFVFFEILLIASYGLLLFGGGKARTRAGLHYVVINLVGSSLFLIAVGTIYGVAGSLNMADVAVRVAALPPSDAALVRTGGLLLFVVFALKAAVLPLGFWLPNAYAAATAPVAALFAIMTKVGVYAIARVYTLVFGPFAGAGADLVLDWLLPAALATTVVGYLGALAARRLQWLVAYLLVASVGTMLAGIGLFTPGGIGAALYYMLHSTLAAAALFLVADLVVRQRGVDGDALVPAARLREPGRLGALYLVGAVAAAGLPPLAGFLGKAMLLAVTPAEPRGWWMWGVILGGSVIGVVAAARAGITVFWHTDRDALDTAPPSRRRVLPAGALMAALLLLAALGEPLVRYTAATADQLLTPAGYVAAVLRETSNPNAPVVKPTASAVRPPARVAPDAPPGAPPDAALDAALDAATPAVAGARLLPVELAP